MATMNDPPQISRTASAAELAWTTVNPSASRARVISSRSVLISFTTRTEYIATSLRGGPAGIYLHQNALQAAFSLLVSSRSAPRPREKVDGMSDQGLSEIVTNVKTKAFTILGRPAMS